VQLNALAINQHMASIGKDRNYQAMEWHIGISDDERQPEQSCKISAADSRPLNVPSAGRSGKRFPQLLRYTLMNKLRNLLANCG